jgi:hypothetical protein
MVHKTGTWTLTTTTTTLTMTTTTTKKKRTVGEKPSLSSDSETDSGVSGRPGDGSAKDEKSGFRQAGNSASPCNRFDAF